MPSGSQMAIQSVHSVFLPKRCVTHWQRGRGVMLTTNTHRCFCHFQCCIGYCVPIKSVFTNAFRELQVKQAKEMYPQMFCKVFVFLTYLKTVKGVCLGSIPGRRIIRGCHILSPFLATLFTVHSRLSLPPPVESFSLVICPLWSVLFHAAEWMVCCSVSPTQRCGNAKRPSRFSEAFIFLIKHWLEELDNLIIDLWWKVGSSGPSAVNDSLFCTFHLRFNFKSTSTLEERKMLWQR